MTCERQDGHAMMGSDSYCRSLSLTLDGFNQLGKNAKPCLDGGLTAWRLTGTFAISGPEKHCKEACCCTPEHTQFLANLLQSVCRRIDGFGSESLDVS